MQQQTELCLTKEFASVKMVEAKTKRRFDWKPLKEYSTQNELVIKKVFDNSNAYNKEAWFACYDISLSDFAVN